MYQEKNDPRKWFRKNNPSLPTFFNNDDVNIFKRKDEFFELSDFF